MFQVLQTVKIEKMYYKLTKRILVHLAQNGYDILEIYKTYIEKNDIPISEFGKKIFEIYDAR